MLSESVGDAAPAVGDSAGIAAGMVVSSGTTMACLLPMEFGMLCHGATAEW